MTYIGKRESPVYKFEFTDAELIILRAALRMRNASAGGSAGEMTDDLLDQIRAAEEDKP